VTAATTSSLAAGRPRSGRRARTAAWVALGVLLASLALLIGLTTPWSVLGARVPGGAVRPDPTLDFTPAEIAREHAYHSAVHPPAWLSLGVGLLVAGVLVLTPLGTRLVGAIGRLVGGRRKTTVALGVVAVVVAARLTTVGFDAWAQAVERRYGLSTQSWPAWMLDQVKGVAVTLVLAVPVLLVAHAVARRMPTWWWAPLAGAGAAMVVGVSFVYPLVVEPVFSHFTSLPAGPLRTSLLDLAGKDHVAVSDVLVADASRRTTTLNAYVSGFGASRRIVLYDTLLRQPRDEVRLIVAHELGHAKRDDVLHGTLEGAVGFAAGVCALYLAATSPWWLRRSRLRGIADPRAVAVLLGATTLLSFAASPVQNLVSRHIEARADVHSLDLTGETRAFVVAHRDLGARGLSTLRPNPVLYALFFDHPSEPERIALARDWARIHQVQPPPPLVPPDRRAR
jgi:STE24 endopeptidase